MPSPPPPPTPSAACGFLGTLLGKHLISQVGVLQAGCRALLIQAGLLGAATALYATYLAAGPSAIPAAAAEAAAQQLGGGGAAGGLLLLGGAAPPLLVVAFAALVVLSRIGVWTFDMCNSQLFQQTVAPREIASASSAEMALCGWVRVGGFGCEVP